MSLTSSSPARRARRARLLFQTLLQLLVRPVIGAEQRCRRDMGIDLGGHQIFMAEKLLDRADIGAGVEQVSGEAVPKRVRGGSTGKTGQKKVLIKSAGDTADR